MRGQVSLNLGPVTALVSFKKIKHMHIRILPPLGEVKISVPEFVAPGELHRFVEEKLPWILDHRERILQRSGGKSLGVHDGAKVSVWGQGGLVRWVERPGRATVSWDGQVLTLAAPSQKDEGQRIKILDQWFKKQLTLALPPLLETWGPRLGVRVDSWGVQKMKTRWGSCQPRMRRLKFNSELAKKDPAALELVVVHELVHLLEPSHNHRFKALMGEFLPDWTQRKRLLEKSL